MMNPLRNRMNLLLLVALVGIGLSRDLHANRHPDLREKNPPSSGTPTFNASTSKDPVDLLTGNRFFTQGDLVLPTPGLPLAFSRQYNSTETDYEGPLGKGWSHALDWRLSETLEMVDDIQIKWRIHGGGDSNDLPFDLYDTAIINLVDGHEIHHQFAPSEGAPIYKLGNGKISLVTAYVLGASTRPAPPAYFNFGNHDYYHAFGPEQHLPRPIGQRPGSVIESISLYPAFTWTNAERTHHWLEVYSGDGRRARLYPQGETFVSQDSPWHIYREAGNYVLVAPGGIERIFSPDGLMRQMRDFAGNRIDLLYSDGKLSEARHSNGTTMAFTYDGDRLSGVEVADDLRLDFTYNENDQLASAIRHVSGQSVTSRYEYTDGFLTQNINALGQTAEYFYESKDNVLTNRSTGMHFETNWIPEQIVYADDDVRRVTYSARGKNPVFEYGFSPKTKLLERKYGPGNDLTDARKRGVSYHYTSTLSATRKPSLAETRYFDGTVGESFSEFTERDSRQLPTTVSVAYGNPASPVPLTHMQWDSHSLQPTEISDPAGGRTRIEYTNRMPVRIHQYYSPTNSHTTRLSYTNGLLASIEDAAGQITAFGYDPAGYLASVTPPAGPSQRLVNNEHGYPVQAEVLPEGSTNGTGRVYGFSRNARGRLDAMTFPDGRSVSMQYDALDRITRLTDAAGRHTDTTYTPLGRVASVTRYLEPTGGAPTATPVRTSIAYDKWLNALDITEPRGRYVETYQLDLQDRPVEITNIEGQTMHINYGLLDFVRSLTRFDGSTVTNTYDNAGRPTAITFASTSATQTLSMAYTASGQPAGISDGAGHIGYFYDRLGQVTNVTQAGTGMIPAAFAYAYDPVGNLTNSTVTLLGTSTLQRQYQHDAANRPTHLQASDAGDWALAYNPTNGAVESLSPLDGGPGVQYAFDIMDRITNIAWQADGGNTLRAFAMDYDNADMITNLVHASGERRVYTYDSIDRLTGEKHLDPTDAVIYSAAYEYDLAGNRTQSVINGVTNTYTLGLGNQLAAWGVNAENTQTYDTAGTVTQITDAAGTRELSWDIQYRLTQVAVDGTLAESYGYYPLGRRAWTSDGSVTNWHVYDGLHVVADVDANGTLLRTYTWGPGIDNLLAITVHDDTTNTYNAITDHLGTVHALADDTGAIVESYRFDAWGNILAVYDASGSPLTSDLGHPSSGIGNRYLWQGREYSWATGLYNFRARWYDPVTGRWLSKDPISISGGLNQYVAFGNNPVMFVDPFGLSAWDWFSNGLALVGGGVQVAAGAVIIGTTGWTGVGAAAGAVLVINGASSVGAAGVNMVQMARGQDASLNNSGYAGLVTSIVTDDPRANTIATSLDLGANLVSGGVGIAAARQALSTSAQVGTVSRYMRDANNIGTLSRADNFLTAEEIAARAYQTSRAVDALTAVGVGATTADSLMNLNRSNKKCP